MEYHWRVSDILLSECEEYHSFFQLLEVTRHTLLSDKMSKLPSDAGEDDMLLLWLSLFKAETEEELEKIKEMEVPVMSQAINAYYTITASSEFREKERLRAKARHDEAQALYNARRDRDIKIARNLLEMNMPHDQIAKATGLTLEEISNL